MLKTTAEPRQNLAILIAVLALAVALDTIATKFCPEFFRPSSEIWGVLTGLSTLFLVFSYWPQENWEDKGGYPRVDSVAQTALRTISLGLLAIFIPKVVAGALVQDNWMPYLLVAIPGVAACVFMVLQQFKTAETSTRSRLKVHE